MLLPTPAEIRRWDRVLAKDGLPSDAALRHWGFPGGRDEADGTNRHGAHLRLETSDQGSYGEIRPIGTDPRFQFWALASAKAQRLPRNFHGRRLVQAIAATGNLLSASRRLRVPRSRARGIWRRFVVAVCGLPDPDPKIVTTYRVRVGRVTTPAEAPPVRTLSKREIARLNIEPPRAIR